MTVTCCCPDCDRTHVLAVEEVARRPPAPAYRGWPRARCGDCSARAECRPRPD